MFSFFQKRKGANESKRPVWRSLKGTIECPGDNCPKECDSTCPIYLNTEGAMMIQIGNYVGAIKKYEEAVAIASDFYDAWNNMASAYGSLGEYLNAYGCYKKAHELSPQKVPPIYGLALCCRDLGRNEECLSWCDCYDELCKDKRTASIREKINEKIKSEVIPSNSNPVKEIDDQTNRYVREESSHVNSSQKAEPITSAEVKNDLEITKEPEALYGKYFLMLLKEETRELGYSHLERLEEWFPEAGVVVGQKYLAIDKAIAREHFIKASNAKIAEGHWGVASCINHSYIPDSSIEDDKQWEFYCLAAAEGDCADAANELGNICNRRQCYIEAMYWYQMASYLDHHDTEISISGVLNKWIRTGKKDDFKVGTRAFTSNRHEATLLILRTLSGEDYQNYINRLLTLALNGELIAGYFLASLYEANENYEMAFRIYNALSFSLNAHVLRCYADFKTTGRGTNKNISEAFKYYEMAAQRGDRAAMFVMGQMAKHNEDTYKAAYWLGMSYTRGYEASIELLTSLS